MINIWQELQKRGYQITNKRILGNPQYTSEETRRKDLIQELALVVDWLLNTKSLEVLSLADSKRKCFYWGVYELFDNASIEDSTEGEEYETPQQATIAAIEYLIENKLI